jgi:hypothetical protein
MKGSARGESGAATERDATTAAATTKLVILSAAKNPVGSMTRFTVAALLLDGRHAFG